jgi:hypothetical protein
VTEREEELNAKTLSSLRRAEKRKTRAARLGRTPYNGKKCKDGAI